jgi:hypothetical protein
MKNCESSVPSFRFAAYPGYRRIHAALSLSPRVTAQELPGGFLAHVPYFEEIKGDL